MTVIFAVTFVISAVLICKWTLSHYDDDGDDDDDDDKLTVSSHFVSNKSVFRVVIQVR